MVGRRAHACIHTRIDRALLVKKREETRSFEFFCHLAPPILLYFREDPPLPVHSGTRNERVRFESGANELMPSATGKNFDHN